MHQIADGKVRHHQAVELLAHQIGRSAAQDNPRAPQVGFQFVQRGLDFPALMIERRQVGGRRPFSGRGWW